MKVSVSPITLPLDAGIPGNEALVAEAAAKALGVGKRQILNWGYRKRSVDARKKSQVHFTATLIVELPDDCPIHPAKNITITPFIPFESLPIPDFSKLLDDAAIVKNVDARTISPFESISAGIKIGAVENADVQAALPKESRYSVDHVHTNQVRRILRPLVAGTGPAGLFAALVLAEAGLKPLIIERGADVDERLRAVQRFSQGGALDTQTNIQFGEGGAGTFSDGKLSTGTKSPHIAQVLHWFVDAGAPQEILWQAKPHIGTDMLVGIVKNLRMRIQQLGGEVRFSTQLLDINCERGKVASVTLQNLDASGSESTYEVPVSHVILACGHSARDTVTMLHGRNLAMERKPFSLGVRIEHLQSLINQVQYGSAFGHPALGAADYKLAVHVPSATPVRDDFHPDNSTNRNVTESSETSQGGSRSQKPIFPTGPRMGSQGKPLNPNANIKTRDQFSNAQSPTPKRNGLRGNANNSNNGLGQPRGVYTFCMCPGGEVVAAASEEGRLCVNGMSNHARDGVNANSALLVDVRPDDLPGTDVLAGIEFQRQWEQVAYDRGFASRGIAFTAPVSTVHDFLNGNEGTRSNFVEPTYPREVAWISLEACLPGFVTAAMKEAFPLLDRKLHGFAHPDAVMTGIESRSSSPVRIIRGADFQAFVLDDLQDPNVSTASLRSQNGASGIYPCGEGAGYAGGIMSAAVDGIRVAQSILESLA